MYERKIKPAKKLTEKQIEALCKKLSLSQSMKGTLRSIGPNIHWHYKNGKQKGVMEITLMCESGEVIFSVHDNRMGGWEKQTIEELIGKL